MEQISFIELEREERAKNTKQILQTGQTIYLLSIDVVLLCVITNAWLCSPKEGSPYYGYRAEGDENNVVFDYEIGNTVFLSREDAERRAREVTCLIEKINPADIELSETQSHKYIRELDNHTLRATIAKVGDNRLYEQEYMCYHFLRTYDTKKKRDAAYKKLVSKINEENARHGATAVEQPKLEVLYKVNDTLYASRGYAINHSEDPIIRASSSWIYRH